MVRNCFPALAETIEELANLALLHQGYILVVSHLRQHLPVILLEGMA